MEVPNIKFGFPRQVLMEVPNIKFGFPRQVLMEVPNIKFEFPQQVLMEVPNIKFGFPRQVLMEVPNIKFYENPSSGCQVDNMRTNMMKFIGAFYEYANVREKFVDNYMR